MFLERFETDDCQLLQGCVRLALVPGRERIADALRSVLACAKIVPDPLLALRVELTADKSLRRTLIILAPAVYEAGLRRFVAMFTRLLAHAAGAVAIPVTREQYQEALGPFPTFQCRTACGGFRSADTWFAADFRLHRQLESLLLEAHAQGSPLWYQCNLLPRTDVAEHLRAARHNLLAMRRLAGLPAECLALQKRLVHRLGHATHLIEEYIGTDDKSAQSWLRRSISQQFDFNHRGMGFNAPSFDFALDQYDDFLASGLHSALASPPGHDEWCASASTEEETLAAVSWAPSETLVRYLRAESAVATESAEERGAPFGMLPSHIPAAGTSCSSAIGTRICQGLRLC